MMMDTFAFRAGDDLPGLTFRWQQETSAGVFTDLDLSSGYTFVMALVDADGVTAFSTTNLTGADGSVTVVFVSGDLDLEAGVYTVELTASETATSKQRSYSPLSPPRIQIV